MGNSQHKLKNKKSRGVVDEEDVTSFFDAVLWTLLCGCSDPGSPLHLLYPVRRTVVYQLIYLPHLSAEFYRSQIIWDTRAAQQTGWIDFPPPSDINVNMMPFVMGKKASLPAYLHGYWEFVERCPVSPEQQGQVCYLSVHESAVKAGESQRRPGLHTEAPGVVQHAHELIMDSSWGGGRSIRSVVGGIFMCSSVSDSCRIYNCEVADPAAVCRKNGDLEHIRAVLEGSRPTTSNVVYWNSKHKVCFTTDKDYIYWITDRTPHESLPLPADTYRQWVRLVCSDISVWYRDHSTENPLCKLPKHVRVIEGDKFS